MFSRDATRPAALRLSVSRSQPNPESAVGRCCRTRPLQIVGWLLLLLLVRVAPAAAQANLGTFSIGQVEIPLAAPDTWSFDFGTLPPGVTLRSDPPSWAPWANATLSGVATTPGNYFFNLRKTGVSQSYMVRISPLAAKDPQLPDAFVGTPYSYQLAALGNAGGVTWTATGGLPGGLTLSNSGLVSGTPTTAGFANVSFSVTDSVDTVYSGVSFQIYAVNITTGGVLPNATQGAYNTTIAASGGSGGYTFAAQCCLPNGLTINAAGTISGTVSPVNTGPGRYGFNVTAIDTNNVSYTKM
ncbi:MAG: hypothetical protein DMF89_01055, partial [Acidobacteria bacterium]